MKRSISEIVNAARRVSTPIIGVTTPDQPETVRQIIGGLTTSTDRHDPVYTWNLADGLRPATKSAREIISQWSEVESDDFAGVHGLVDFLANFSGAKQHRQARKWDFGLKHPRSVLLVFGADECLRDPVAVQAIANCRDRLKADQKTLIFLDASLEIPSGLAHDVMVLDQPLPNDFELAGIIDEMVLCVQASRKMDSPDEGSIADGVSALRGLSGFEAEQAVAMTLDEHLALDSASLSERRSAYINAVPGLSVDESDCTFHDVCGLSHAKTFLTQLFTGPEKPAVVVRIDELEKKISGNEDGYHGSATGKDELQVLLTEMEDNGWSGQIAYGHPGCSKTLLTRAVGKTFGVQTLVLDLGATRSKFVGESEQKIRRAMKTIKAIGGDRVYVMATCNELQSVPPELKRRFVDGVWFYDLPTDAERVSLCRMYLEKYNQLPITATIQDTSTLDRFVDRCQDLTGAEIRNVCWIAHRLNISLLEAVKEVVPIKMSDAASIARRRSIATGTHKNASASGVYLDLGDA